MKADRYLNDRKQQDSELKFVLKEKNAHLERANELDTELSETRNKLRQFEKENKVLNRKNNTLTSEKDRLAKEKLEIQNEKNITKTGVNALTREIEYLRKQSEAGEKKIASLIKDKDTIAQNIEKVTEDNAENRNKLIEAQQKINKLQEKKQHLMR